MMQTDKKAYTLTKRLIPGKTGLYQTKEALVMDYLYKEESKEAQE